jgi:hypothetical protein
LQEDFSLLDLSDQELELLIEKGPFASDTKQAIGTQSGPYDTDMSVLEPSSRAELEEGPPAFETGPVETPLTAGAAHALGDDLTPHDDKPQTAPIPEFISELPGLGPEVPKSAPAEFAAPTEPAGSKLDELTDDFVIELSENDLDTLLQELNSTTSGEVEQGGKG